MPITLHICRDRFTSGTGGVESLPGCMFTMSTLPSEAKGWKEAALALLSNLNETLHSGRNVLLQLLVRGLLHGFQGRNRGNLSF